MNVIFDIPEIIFSADSMKAEKMSCKPFTEPIAEFGLKKPVFPDVMIYVPEIYLTRNVKCPFSIETYFYS